MVESSFVGYINRHDHCLLPQIEHATEVAEIPIIYFAEDKILLRYRMHCCETDCWRAVTWEHVIHESHRRCGSDARAGSLVLPVRCVTNVRRLFALSLSCSAASRHVSKCVCRNDISGMQRVAQSMW